MVSIGSVLSMSKLDNSSGDFESLGTQLPYEVEDKTDGFHFVPFTSREGSLKTRTKLIRKEQREVLHSEREGTERAGGISRCLHGILHLNDRKKRAELCLFRDRKGRPIRIKDDCLVAASISVLDLFFPLALRKGKHF